MRFLSCLILTLFLQGNACQAQDITGTWEGIMGDEYIKLNIKQVNRQLCGYSHDFVLTNKSSQCIALFEGSYNSVSRTWTITGTSFIDNSGDHVLMTIRLWNADPSRSNVLRACVITSEDEMKDPSEADPDFFWIRKYSSKPGQQVPGAYACYEPPHPVTTKKNTVPKKNNQAATTLKKAIINSKDTSEKTREIIDNKNTPDPFTVKTEPPSREFSETKNRKSHTETILTVHDPVLVLQIFDNGIIDNDTVSIFFDGVMLYSKKRLTATPLICKMTLKDPDKEHELLMFAENLGSIPPNTAMVVITAGKNRYELHASANLDDNSVIKIRYVPDQK